MEYWNLGKFLVALKSVIVFNIMSMCVYILLSIFYCFSTICRRGLFKDIYLTPVLLTTKTITQRAQQTGRIQCHSGGGAGQRLADKILS